MSSIDLRVGRRTFLRIGGMSAAMLELSRLGLPAAAAARERVLSERDALVLSAIGERMTFSGDPAMPSFAATGAMATIDQVLAPAPEDVRQQLHWALVLFQYGPPLLLHRFATFTGLGAKEQDEYLASWESSGFAVFRQAFDAFKNLTMLGYYAQDETWKAIHYDGPWLPRPRRYAS